MKTLANFFIILLAAAGNLFASPPANENGIERVILLYIDGFHPEALQRYRLTNLNELKSGGTSAETGMMTFPVHPTIWPYGAYHTTSLPNITTLAGTMFIDERQHFFHHDLPAGYIKLHAAGSNAYQSMNDGFQYVLTHSRATDSNLIDFTINAFEKEGDVKFCRIHLQEAGLAGRTRSGRELGNVPWAQNIFAENSPYEQAVYNADKQIGRLFDYLKQTDRWQSTLIVFMGDGQAPTGWHLYMFEDAWLTPIIFHGPGIRPNHTIPYAENIDVIPTIAHLWNIPLKNVNGGTGRVLKEVMSNQPAQQPPHPRWTEKINRQLKEYTVLKARADIVSAEDPKMNLLLMELQNQTIIPHAFYNYDRILEWKQAGTLQQMYESNQWVMERIKRALEGQYQFGE